MLVPGWPGSNVDMGPCHHLLGPGARGETRTHKDADTAPQPQQFVVLIGFLNLYIDTVMKASLRVSCLCLHCNQDTYQQNCHELLTNR